MAIPNSRTDLREHCLRRLGKPVLQINVDSDQVEDCIDDAIQVFQEFHSDATKRVFLKHEVTDSDVTNKYIPVSSDVIFLKRILPFDTSSLGIGSGMFSAKYQIHLNDIANLSNFSANISYYNQIGQFLETLDMVLTGVPQITFQRYENRIYIHGEWWDQEIKAGDYLIAEGYQIIDPDSNTSIYNNIFLKDMTTSLIKQRWGQNLSKYEGMTLPGGVTLNASRLIDESREEITELRERMRLEYEVPPNMFMG